MKFSELGLANAFSIETKPLSDSRGYFNRVFCAEEFSKYNLPTFWPQCNNSFTRCAGTIRGLHFQLAPKEETKLIKCTNGVVFDVIVDLRADSPTFGNWHAEKLDAAKHNMICIPGGFAHGFQALTANAEMLYFHSSPYQPEYEGGVRWDDKSLNIKWPLALTKISDRDAKLPFLSQLKQTKK